MSMINESLNSARKIVIKIGSNTLAKADGTTNIDFMLDFAEQCASLIKQGKHAPYTTSMLPSNAKSGMLNPAGAMTNSVCLSRVLYPIVSSLNIGFEPSFTIIFLRTLQSIPRW